MSTSTAIVKAPTSGMRLLSHLYRIHPIFVDLDDDLKAKVAPRLSDDLFMFLLVGMEEEGLIQIVNLDLGDEPLAVMLTHNGAAMACSVVMA